MRMRSPSFRTFRASPGLTFSVILAWMAGFGLGSAVLGRVGGAGAWSHPLLAGFEEADLDSLVEGLKSERTGGGTNLSGAIELPADEAAVAVAAWPVTVAVPAPPRRLRGC